MAEPALHLSLPAWLHVLEQERVAPYSTLHAVERCAKILERLNFKKFCPVITVGGTNGKGSTSYFISAYITASGKKVGRFTSPHLISYNERIAINDQNVADAVIVQAFEQIRAVQQDMHLGYFDYCFLAAAIIFWQERVDIMVLEVGLGGRLDATNSIDTDCAILTTIDFDHTAILGKTREAIGFEKAGIFRPAKLAVSGDTHTPESVRCYAAAIQARFFERGRDFDFTEHFLQLPQPHFPLQNALTAMEALKLLDKEKILVFDFERAALILQTLHIPGRMQKLQDSPEIIVDVAHNPASVHYLLEKLKKKPVKGRRIAVFSALKDKEILEMGQRCADVFSIWNLIVLDHPRAAEKELLMQAVPGAAQAQYFDSIEHLMDNLLKEIQDDDQVIVFGSFLIVNRFLSCYNQKKIAEINNGF